MGTWNKRTKMKLFGLISGLVAADEIVRYDGDRVYGFDDLSNGVIQHLKTYNRGFEQSFDFWSPDSAEEMVPGGEARIRVKKEFADEFETLLDDFDIDFDILSHNVQHDIDMETMSLQGQGRAHSLTNYNDYDTIKSWLKSLNGATYKEFGETVNGRALMAVEIGSGSKVISVDCGIHAREWISPAYCQWFINEALNGKFAKYTSEFKFIVQPSVNPDGYAYTWTNQRLWRKNRSPQGNCVGVDLNRNYDANWGGPGASGSPCSDTFRGNSVFSEKESQAQRDYITPFIKDKSLKAFVTFHSYGQYILYPYSYDYTSQSPNKAEMNTVGQKMKDAIQKVHRKSYTMGQGTNVLYPAAGGSDDWAHDVMLDNGNNGPLSYTIELRDTGSFGFVLPANQIQPNAEEIDAAMEELIEYVKSNK